jgi:hypothetical protein
MREEKEPTVSEGRIGKSDAHDVYNHEAFGTIKMTTPTGGDKTLFGSDIYHNQRVSISIQRARLDRHLNNDWIHSELMPLVEIEMSHSQFAQFITSSGNGSGTPVTLRYAPPVGAACAEMAAIKKIETKADMFRREIKDIAKRQLEKISKQVEQLGEMIESGKMSKKELREIHNSLTWAVGNAPGDMQYVVGKAEEALEKATAHSKIEVEAYIDGAVRRVGIDAARSMGLVTKETKEVSLIDGEHKHVVE